MNDRLPADLRDFGLEKTESPEMLFRRWVEGLAARPAEARQQVTNDRFWNDLTKLARAYIDCTAEKGF